MKFIENMRLKEGRETLKNEIEKHREYLGKKKFLSELKIEDMNLDLIDNWINVLKEFESLRQNFRCYPERLFNVNKLDIFDMKEKTIIYSEFSSIIKEISDLVYKYTKDVHRSIYSVRNLNKRIILDENNGQVSDILKSYYIFLILINEKHQILCEEIIKNKLSKNVKENIEFISKLEYDFSKLKNVDILKGNFCYLMPEEILNEKYKRTKKVIRRYIVKSEEINEKTSKNIGKDLKKELEKLKEEETDIALIDKALAHHIEQYIIFDSVFKNSSKKELKEFYINYKELLENMKLTNKKNLEKKLKSYILENRKN